MRCRIFRKMIVIFSLIIMQLLAWDRAAVKPDLFINPNILFAKASETAEGELSFVVEIPEGSSKKYELRTVSGQLFLDREICPRIVPGTGRFLREYPMSYGITPGRFNVDGGPLDLVVMGRGWYYREQVDTGNLKAVQVRVIGLLKMEECEDPPCRDGNWLQDYKIMAVDPADNNYNGVRRHTDLAPERLESVVEFSANYKGHQDGLSLTRVTGIGSRDDAVQYQNS